MDQTEIDRHAERIAEEALENLEFSYVYEDEELEDASEQDWQHIHDAITHRATVTIEEEN